MIWATVSSGSCFCWLYRASSSWTAKNIISVISSLTFWWCPCVESSHVAGKECLLWPVRSLGETLLAFALFHFVLPRPNLPVTPDIPWPPPSAFQSPMMKGHLFLVLVVESELQGSVFPHLFSLSLPPILCYTVTAFSMTRTRSIK